MNYLKFREEEIPYATLEMYSLTREMIDDLPQAVLENIMSGRMSPLLPISVKDDEGNTIRSRTRFSLYRQEGGSVDVLFYPQLMRCDLGQYNDEEQKALLAGRAIVSHSPDDTTSKCFVQIDAETNQVMYVPTPVIGRNLSCLMDSYNLSNAEIQLIQNGSPLTVVDGDAVVTVGIDLREKTGIGIVQGDEKRWMEHKDSIIGKYNFGIFGCWVKGDDGNLDYIHEEDYTDELWAEQKKVIEQNTNIKR